MPMPATMKPGSSAVQRESESSPYINARPPATSISPAPIIARSGTRAAKRRVASGTKKTKAVSGRKRRPAPSGEYPRMSCR